MPSDILLINPPYPSESREAAPPLGICSIASYLDNNGFRGRVELIDGFALQRKQGYGKSLDMIKERIKKDRPFIVGCSVLYTNEKEAYELMNVANEVGSHTVVGNYMAGDAYESITNVTAIVRGEGEVTTKELVDALSSNKDLKGIRGLTFRSGEKIIANPDRELVNLDSLPPPAFHLLDPKDYSYLSIEESRGCCFRCSFCSITKLYQGYRLKSPERIRSEVEKIVDFGIKKIDLIGEMVLFDGDRAVKIGEAMREFSCDWKINAHPTLVVKSKRTLPLLSERGLRIIETAVESGSQNSLNVYNKQTTPKINEAAVSAVVESGIMPFIDFINFHPYLTMRDLEDNIRFILRHLPYFSKSPYYPEDNIFKPWIPIPKTPLFERVNSEKLLMSGGIEDSFLKMNYSRFSFVFKDEAVRKVADLVDYFLKEFGGRYHRMLQPSIEDGSIFSDSPRMKALELIPAFVLCMAYALVKNDIAGKDIIGWYCQQRLDAINRGQYEAELPSIPFFQEKMGNIIEVIKDLAS